LLPRRQLRSSKAGGGRTLVLAGSRGMYGAGVLAATAAARVGAGYVTLLTEGAQGLGLLHPDFLTCQDSGLGRALAGATAVACGPGLGTQARAQKVFAKLLMVAPKRVVLDADGLNLLSKKRRAPKLPKNWVLTPHEGEMARLLDVTRNEISANRQQAVRAAQKKFSCVVLLKGAGTLVCDGRRLVKINSGNAALAKAGTGDVLTGMIVGLLSQGLEGFEAACLGAYLHGLVADRWIQSGRDQLSLMPSDLLNDLPSALKALRSRQT
jgi:ADP-dependent NAD(P)H-hydrate dehydratase